MNILHIALDLGRAGIGALLCSLGAAQVRQGHAVRVLCLYARGELAAHLEQDAVSVECYGMKDWRREREKIAWAHWLRRYLRRHRIDGVIEHCGVEAHAAWACTSVGVPYMVSVIHGTYPARVPLKRMFQHRVFLQRYRSFVAVSRSVRAFEMRRYGVPGNRIRVIPNGVALERFRPGRCSLDTRRRILGAALEDGQVVVGTVGNLRPVKNHELLLRAWASVAARCPTPGKLVIVGGGPLAETLRRKRDALGLGSSVLLLGPRSDVPDLLGCFDIFVMSSKHEGQPLAALEAMACGLPVVGTRVSGLRDVVEAGINGLLVDPSEPEPLARAIEKLILDPALRSSLGAAGRRIVEGRYSVHRCARLYEQTLLESRL